MRIAMLGLGDIAQKAYLPLVASHPKIVPLLCTRNTQILRRLQAQYRVNEVYSDVADLLASHPDAVMIHSSTDSHFPLAQRFLTAGIPVFIDKPISYHYAECEQLVNLAVLKNLPLIMGFNRRFAPMYQHFAGTAAIQIHYQKNRYNLPANPRQYIYDDFIHVLDYLRHCAQQMPANIDVFAHQQAGWLGALQVQWQHKGCLYSGMMNRLNGATEERLEYYAKNKKWQIESLREGQVWENNSSSPLKFDDWQTTLTKRGFVSMIDDMLLQLEDGTNYATRSQQTLDTHRLCEQVVNKVETTFL
ncbi:Gfo/Idh/MocA family oxidoreductase [Paraglaciecola sp.]|uniref:Gfo/Idh/MocA family protein n=1 Tax=Paraglaciecola sp. TaxID=1920173 RepID=UPI0030F47BEB